MIEAAAAGRLPAWAEAGEARRAHMARVAALMDAWAEGLGLDGAERVRWRAAAWLHDALRDADPERIRGLLPPELRDLPPPLVHGPAAAVRLRQDGVADESLLRAIAYHTIGHPSLDRLGRALYLADFLEPGRTFDPGGRAALRARMPEAMDAVLATVVERRIAYLLVGRRRLRLETIQFWNELPVVG
ncbi:MAG TPA: HD domain-containing protein [Longimicrobiales bacterium]|nr:HD domain-containing protein [Longimicrobiales bacterium]